MTIFKEISKADYVTLTGVASIVTAFWFLVLGEFSLAVSFALIGIFFDFTDGMVARKYGSSEYGKILDSLFDVLGFVLFPSLLIVLNGSHSLWVLIAIILYCLSAFLRLARFTIRGFGKDTSHYIGMPVLCSIFAIIFFQFAESLFSLIWLIIMTPLMVSDYKFHKPKHPIYGIVLILLAIRFLYAR